MNLLLYVLNYLQESVLCTHAWDSISYKLQLWPPLSLRLLLHKYWLIQQKLKTTGSPVNIFGYLTLSNISITKVFVLLSTWSIIMSQSKQKPSGSYLHQQYKSSDYVEARLFLLKTRSLINFFYLSLYPKQGFTYTYKCLTAKWKRRWRYNGRYINVQRDWASLVHLAMFLCQSVRPCVCTRTKVLVFELSIWSLVYELFSPKKYSFAKSADIGPL